MAAKMIPAGNSLVLPEIFASPPDNDAAPAIHLAWCERFADYCLHQAQLTLFLGLPTRGWRHAADLALFSASIWRQRAGGAV